MQILQEPDAAAVAADMACCAELLAQGSRTFHAASRVLPARIRQPAMALYAFCRVADDAVDGDVLGGSADAAMRLRGLQQMHDRLDRVYAGQPRQVATDRAFAAVVARHRIPRALPQALLEGFEWDVVGRRYPDLEALQGYAARVAGSVGAMMALIMGVTDREVVDRACDLGVAMQLTNIARDVGEDARANRLYLPLDWLAEAGIDPEAFLARPVHSDALAQVIARLLGVADAIYRRATEGIAHLPLDCRPGIFAARLLYADIGHALAQRRHDSVTQRAVVGRGRKLALLGRALFVPMRGADFASAAPGLAATRFLIEALAQAPGAVPSRGRAGAVPGSTLTATLAPTPARGLAAIPRRVHERAVWVLDLMERLERMERTERLVRMERTSGG